MKIAGVFFRQALLELLKRFIIWAIVGAGLVFMTMYGAELFVKAWEHETGKYAASARAITEEAR